MWPLQASWKNNFRRNGTDFRGPNRIFRLNESLEGNHLQAKAMNPLKGRLLSSRSAVLSLDVFPWGAALCRLCRLRSEKPGGVGNVYRL